MNATPALDNARQTLIDEALYHATSAIAPQWPLDELAACSPFWGRRHEPFLGANRNLTRLAGISLWMPMEYYQECYRKGKITDADIVTALQERGQEDTLQTILDSLSSDVERTPQFPLLVDVVDEEPRSAGLPLRSNSITTQISKFCASYFDRHSAEWRTSYATKMYAEFVSTLSADLNTAMLLEDPGLSARVGALPTNPYEMINLALSQFKINAEYACDFFQACLYRIHGWAAHCAYRGWQAKLNGQTDSSIVQLLAIRLAWEVALDCESTHGRSRWLRWKERYNRFYHTEKTNDIRWALQRAQEIRFQRVLCKDIQSTASNALENYSSHLIFCIDVRSERIRRALEQTNASIQTFGFAGFFGVPVGYAPMGTYTVRPHLPGLLSPAIPATDTTGRGSTDATLAKQRSHALESHHSYKQLKQMPLSGFTAVETLGVGYLAKLLSPPSDTRHSGGCTSNRFGLPKGDYRLRPVLKLSKSQRLTAETDICEQVLRSLNLTDNFGSFIVVCGHGSSSANNPQAAALDCGACCGQKGDVNAQLLASFLNNKRVRKELGKRGITIPASTYALAAMHNTTTDELIMFDKESVPPRFQEALSLLLEDMTKASQLTRAERAPSLGLAKLQDKPARLLKSLKKRAADWSQTRPEWGLAGNAAFIIAPRNRTIGVNLDGRSFLHEYDSASDEEGTLLQQILSGPMLVTNWINMQYYGSTVDNQKLGSGNKVLHNVVGGRIGVLEGNGGDLRFGLARQSIHDGSDYTHEPLRLSVFVEAPRRVIETALEASEEAAVLCQNEWVHLFRIDSQTQEIECWKRGRWTTFV